MQNKHVSTCLFCNNFAKYALFYYLYIYFLYINLSPCVAKCVGISHEQTCLLSVSSHRNRMSIRCMIFSGSSQIFSASLVRFSFSSSSIYRFILTPRPSTPCTIR